MDTFKSKLKLISDNVDTLSYIKHSNDSINISTDLKMKEGNYNINNISIRKYLIYIISNNLKNILRLYFILQ